MHRTEHVGSWYSDLFEKDFVELCISGDLYQRADSHSRCLHVNDETRNPTVFRCIWVRAYKQLNEVRLVRKTGPHLLTVDHEIVAILTRSRLQGCKVRP